MIERIAHYKVLKELGSGAMGRVYKAVDENLNMLVAIKVLEPAIALDESNLVRFEREARAAANLKHQHIAHVFFVGRTSENLPFYAMEYVDGSPLQDIIDKRSIMTGRQMLTIMKQCCQALQFSSDKGVLHRDIKPGNIMIEREGGVKIVDFGIAKTTSDRDVKLTSTGMGLGTPTYVSPEQAQSLNIDFRSDMYSLGITFFELLTGTVPYKAETLVNVIIKHMHDPIPDILSLNPRFPRSLCQIIERMMAKKPEGRFLSFNEIHDALEHVLVTENAFADSYWAFCERCGVTELVVDPSLCFRCRQSLEAPDEEVVYMAVYLNSLSGPDARRMVSSYMQKSTGRSAEAINIMLQNLPLMLSPRLPFENAKTIQNKLYLLGAEVSIKKVAVGKVKKGQARPILEYGSGERGREATVQMSATYPQIIDPLRRRNRFSRTYIVVLGVLMLLSAVAAYVMYDSPEKPAENGENPAAAVNGAEKPANPAVDDNSGNSSAPVMTTFASRNGLCRFNVIEISEKAVIDELGDLCEAQVKELKYSYGLYKTDAPLFILDGRKDFELMFPVLGLDLAAGEDGIPFYAKWLKNGTNRTGSVIRAGVARNLLRQVSGGKMLPAWFESGFALQEVIKSALPVFEISEKFSASEGYLKGSSWDSALEEGSPRAYAQAALFSVWLNEKFPGSTMRLARQMAQGYDFDNAFLRVFFKTHTAMLEEWFEEYGKSEQ